MVKFRFQQTQLSENNIGFIVFFRNQVTGGTRIYQTFQCIIADGNRDHTVVFKINFQGVIVLNVTAANPNPCHGRRLSQFKG